jgi:hypothetical protein
VPVVVPETTIAGVVDAAVIGPVPVVIIAGVPNAAADMPEASLAGIIYATRSNLRSNWSPA